MPAAPGAGVTDVHADGKFYFFLRVCIGLRITIRPRLKELEYSAFFFFNFYFLMFTLLG